MKVLHLWQRQRHSRTCLVRVRDNDEAILSPDKIPNTITKQRRYFERLFPNGKGGNLNPGIRIAFDSDRETLQEQVRYELGQNNIYLYLKSIQHGETAKKYYLQNFLPDGDLEYWTEWMKKQMMIEV